MNGTIRLADYTDNDEAVYEVEPSEARDIAAGVSRSRTVSQREVCEMFIRFSGSKVRSS